MNSKLPNLAGRSSWLIGLGAVAILCCLTLWSAWNDHSTTLRESQNKRHALARIAETNLASNFRIIERFLSRIAAECDESPLDSPPLQESLRQMLPLVPDAVSIVIADDNGTLHSATDPAALGANVSSRSYFAHLKRTPETRLFISEPFDTVTNKRIMVASRPILNADRSFRGVIGIAIRPEFVTNTLLAALPGPHGSVVLFGKDYIVRTRVPDDANAEGKSLKGLPITERFIGSGKQVDDYRVQATLDGTERFVSFRQLDFPDSLILTVSDSTESVLTGWTRKTLALALLTIAGSILIMLLAFSSNRSIAAAARSDAALMQRDILLGTVLANLPVKVCARDIHGRIIYQSKSCSLLDKNIQDHPTQQELNPEAALQSWKILNAKALAGKSTTSQHTVTLPSGEHKLIESYSGPIVDGNTIIGVLGVDIDVTDYKTIEAKLLHALSEKEVMLKEIHHRVKNNLQIIMSLINLQNDICTDEKTNDALVQTYERIRTMALVHEHLYKSEDVGIVHIAYYIPNLVEKISNAFGRDGLMVSIHHDIQDVKMNIDRAIPFGLIVNELVMNAFKHAFVLHESNSLFMTFRHIDSGLAELTVEDNGPGLPQSYDPESEETLGMRLVTNLVAQLKGTLRYSGERGACFRITLPIQ